MNSPLFPVAIYPSQLDAFKAKAKLLSTCISDTFSIKKLSAFKRNDYLAIALGYKGHPDLVESTKFRQASDTEQQLLVFSNKAIRESIAEVFSSKLPDISGINILAICEKLENSELGSLVLSDTRKMLQGSIVDKPKESTQDINPMLFLDDWGNSPEAIEERHAAAKFLTEQEVKRSPKKSNINVVIDLSEIPMSIVKVLYDHRHWLKFENEVKLRSRKHNVALKLLAPATADGINDHWKIRASIDTWCELEPTSQLLDLWNEFKEWLMSFYATDRIHITERINSHRWSTPIIQFHVNNPIEYQLSQLTKLDDIALFNLLSIQKGQYGDIFEHEVAEVDFNEVIKRNKNIYVDLGALEKPGSTGKGKHPFSTLVESALNAQRKDVAQAKQALAHKYSENYGGDIQVLCDHAITDTFGDVENGEQEHRCLVCDKRWIEKVALWDEQDLKDHVDAIGQGNGISQIAVNLEQSLFAPVLTDSSLKDLIQMVESRWPEGATCATQECDGEILFWSAPVDEVITARKQANLEDGLMPLIGIGQQIHANYYEIDEQAYVASDWQTAVVTKEQVNLS